MSVDPNLWLPGTGRDETRVPEYVVSSTSTPHLESLPTDVRPWVVGFSTSTESPRGGWIFDGERPDRQPKKELCYPTTMVGTTSTVRRVSQGVPGVQVRRDPGDAGV